MKNLHNCVYPELAFVLREFAAGLQTALGSNVPGAYLVGSLATGDFDLDSDVDFLVVTKVELCDAEVKSLEATHSHIHGLGSYPAEHLEGLILVRSCWLGLIPLVYNRFGTSTMEVHRWSVPFTTIDGTFDGFSASEA